MILIIVIYDIKTYPCKYQALVDKYIGQCTISMHQIVDGVKNLPN
jgi:hypothetical protein